MSAGWTMVAIAAVSAISSFMNARKQQKAAKKAGNRDYYPLSSFLPGEYLALFDPSYKYYNQLSKIDTPLARALEKMLSRAGHAGELPAGLEQMTLGDVREEGMQRRQRFNNAAAMTGMGFSPSMTEGFARGEAAQTADARAKLASLSRSFEAQDLGWIDRLMNVYMGAQSQRFGTPILGPQATTDPYAAAMMTAGAGLGAAADYFNNQNNQNDFWQQYAASIASSTPSTTNDYTLYDASAGAVTGNTGTGNWWNNYNPTSDPWADYGLWNNP